MHATRFAVASLLSLVLGAAVSRTLYATTPVGCVDNDCEAVLKAGLKYLSWSESESFISSFQEWIYTCTREEYEKQRGAGLAIPGIGTGSVSDEEWSRVERLRSERRIQDLNVSRMRSLVSLSTDPRALELWAECMKRKQRGLFIYDEEASLGRHAIYLQYRRVNPSDPEEVTIDEISLNEKDVTADFGQKKLRLRDLAAPQRYVFSVEREKDDYTIYMRASEISEPILRKLPKIVVSNPTVHQLELRDASIIPGSYQSAQQAVPWMRVTGHADKISGQRITLSSRSKIPLTVIPTQSIFAAAELISIEIQARRDGTDIEQVLGVFTIDVANTVPGKWYTARVQYHHPAVHTVQEISGDCEISYRLKSSSEIVQPMNRIFQTRGNDR